MSCLRDLRLKILRQNLSLSNFVPFHELLLISVISLAVLESVISFMSIFQFVAAEGVSEGRDKFGGERLLNSQIGLRTAAKVQ